MNPTTTPEISSIQHALTRKLRDLGVFAQIESQLSTGSRVISISGVQEPAKPFFIAALNLFSGCHIAYVVPSSARLDALRSEIEFHCRLLGGTQRNIASLPSSESNPYDGTSPHPAVEAARALTLSGLERESLDVVALPARSLIQRSHPRSEWKNLRLDLLIDDECALEDVMELLTTTGYVREDPVTEMGSYSSRGGILDVFSPGRARPARIEFFGDRIESIREFDPETQRSTATLRECALLPMRTRIATRENLRLWAERAVEHWAAPEFQFELRSKTSVAEFGETFPGWEYLLPLVAPLGGSLFEYLDEFLFVIDEPAQCKQQLLTLAQNLQVRYREALDNGELGLEPEKLFLSIEELASAIHERSRLDLRSLGLIAPDPGDRMTTVFAIPETTMALEFSSLPAPRFHSRIADLSRSIAQWRAAQQTVVMVTTTLGVAERCVDLLREYEIGACIVNPATAPDAPSSDTPSLEHQTTEAVTLVVGSPESGFLLPAGGLVLLAEADLFDQARPPVVTRPPSAKKKSVAASFLSDFRDLKTGDFVVHIDHGIGQYQGLQQLELQTEPGRRKVVREFMLLSYADGAKLYAPVERLDLVQKYSSSESGHTPQLDKLGGIGWAKTKAKAKRAMRDMAEELLKLYAERSVVDGYAFTADGPWHKEFDDAFEYELTPDQDTAISDIRTDMERPRPMDRLLCGDVGYGKTEVAMRAAFKSVMDGKQVAVLAPTTVLAYQHYKTFTARFAAFPVTTDLLSRFRSPTENKEVLKRAEQGKLDVVIGTHRLLSKDVRFKDLGLLVVDEEQRFGVAHKEKLKQLKKKVDVLTMTATPIPRTLNMSLMGLRDISVIETPPSDRLAIKTSVIQFSEPVVKSAIELEIDRGGQVFFVHNRVESIYTVAEMIQRIVPRARVAVGHGQMHEHQLERAMLSFVEHEVDVLAATTIIENGIDIPLANTIIINRADEYGLAQLYQLRGRVGRSNRRAYAYLVVPSEKTLTPIARRRLAAIREFSDLGAGFRIAALDLELRGGGQLLGGRQSGHLDAIGFDLYTAMLARTVQELRGEEVKDEIPVQMNLGLDTRIPEEMIDDISQRLRAYKRISSAESESELHLIAAELEDRYGRLPDSVTNLFTYAQLRLEAQSLHVLTLDRKGEDVTIKFREDAPIDASRLMSALGQFPSATMSQGGVLRLKVPRDDDQGIFATIENLFRRI